MAQKKSYSRYFIILQEDEKGYSLSSDKVASGYAKLELKNDKCKISYYVQNLKKEITPYYMILICSKKDVKKIIKIGEMNIDDYGRADICYEYPVNDVASSNISMDKVTGAAIVKLVDGNITSVMSGFASTEIPDWKRFVLVENKARSSNEEEIVIEEKSIFDKYEESIELTKQEERKENIDIIEVQDDLEQIRKEVISEESEIDDVPKDEITETLRHEESIEEIDFIVEKEELEPLKTETNNKRDSGEEGEDENKELCESANLDDEQYRNEEKGSEYYPRGDTAEFFRSLVQEFEELPNICKEIKRCSWYKVPIKSEQDNNDKSNDDRYRMIYAPMVSYLNYIEKYGHCLIGYKYNKDGEVKYLMYGIPGKRDLKEQPYEGRSGFVTWVPIDESELEGYWIMFYDLKTSTIVIPMKK